MQFSLGVIATRHTASLYANVKQNMLFTNEKIGCVQLSSLAKEYKYKWVGLQHVWTVPKKQVKKAKTKFTPVGEGESGR